MQIAITLAIGVLVVAFVPGLVWVTVIAGLYQLAHQKVRERDASVRQ